MKKKLGKRYRGLSDFQIIADAIQIIRSNGVETIKPEEILKLAGDGKIELFVKSFMDGDEKYFPLEKGKAKEVYQSFPNDSIELEPESLKVTDKNIFLNLKFLATKSNQISAWDDQIFHIPISTPQRFFYLSYAGINDILNKTTNQHLVPRKVSPHWEEDRIQLLMAALLEINRDLRKVEKEQNLFTGKPRRINVEKLTYQIIASAEAKQNRHLKNEKPPSSHRLKKLLNDALGLKLG